MSDLPKLFLERLSAKIDNQNTTGILLTGSFARGDAGRYSDVDIRQYLREMPEGLKDKYRLEFMEDRLVSLTLTTLDETHASLQDPQKAIWILPGLQQSRILLDRDGSLLQLMQKVHTFSWESLQASAERAVSRGLRGYAEEVHKILAGLEREDESMVLYAVWGLTHGMANLMAVGNGIMVPSENVFIDLVQAAAGRDSTWTGLFRKAVGHDPLPPENPAFVVYGGASLRLYRESVKLFKDMLTREDMDVVQKTLLLIKEAGY